MSRRETSETVTPGPVLSCIPNQRTKSVFAEWLDRERVALDALAGELGITVSYVRILAKGRSTPGAKLRLRIQERTGGFVRFDSW